MALQNLIVKLFVVHEINKKQAGFTPREVALLSHKGKGKGKVCIRAKWHIRPALISGFCDMKRLGVFLLPPGWDASPSQGYPQR